MNEALRRVPRPTGVVWFAALLAISTLCSIFVGCRPASQRPALGPLRLGTYMWPGSYWIDVAVAKGWFEEAGLQVERVNTDLQYFASQDAVAEGRLDAMGFSQFDLVRHVAAGHDLVGVAAIDYSAGAEALVARGGIHRIRDLKGKRLALYRGTYLEYLLAIVAEREGLNLADVELIDRSGEQTIDDFRKGRVDAIIAWEPYVSQAKSAGGTELFSTADFPGLTYSILTLRRDFVEAHPQIVAALIGVWERGEKFVRQNPEATCVIVGEAFKETPASACDLLRTVRVMSLADNSRAFSYAAGFESLHASWRRMNDFMLERAWVRQRVDSPSHLDAEFVRTLK